MSIKIDQEFSALIPPLTSEEYAQLEKNIIKDGIRDPLVIWPQPDGNSILIDGHNRMRIAEAHHGLAFDTVERYFSDRDQAILWIINNQLGRRNLPVIDRVTLEDKKKDVLAKQAKENLGGDHKSEEFRKSKDKNSCPLISRQEKRKNSTDYKIAQAAGTSEDTVRKVRKINELATDKTKQLVREGKLSINQAYNSVAPKRPDPVKQAKQELIREQLLETPERSDRQIAKDLGIAHTTVSRNREKLVSDGQVEQRTTSVGSDGKQYPRQVERKQPEPVVMVEPEAEPVVETELEEEPDWTSPDTQVEQETHYAPPVVEANESAPEWWSGETIDVPKTEPVKKPHVVNNSTDNEWYTPAEYIEAAREAMGSIDLDPASNDFANKTVKAGTYYTEETDGLSKEWFGNIWLNPPYQTSLIGRFADKLNESNFNQAIVLVNNASETQWFQKMAEKATAFVWHLGRIRFEKRDGAHGVPLQGQIFLYFGNNPDGFLKVFTKYGRGSALDEKLSE